VELRGGSVKSFNGVSAGIVLRGQKEKSGNIFSENFSGGLLVKSHNNGEFEGFNPFLKVCNS